VRYWRDKRGHEVDFILAPRGKDPIAIECKWKAESFDPSSVLAFRRRYLAGANYVVAGDVSRASRRKYDGVEVSFVSLHGLLQGLQTGGAGARA
jgi:hypothetical protein